MEQLQKEQLDYQKLHADLSDAVCSGKLKFWEDPGHGWLQVPIKLVNKLIKAKRLKVSRFSYKDRDNAYLEEDCDVTSFVNCFPDVNFRQLFSSGAIRSEHREHIFIRNLGRF